MRIPLFLRVLPVYLLILLLLALPFWQKHQEKARAVAAGKLAAAVLQNNQVNRSVDVPLLEGIPSRIVIGEVGVDVPIVSGRYIQQKTVWSVSGKAANYAANTAVLNNKKDATLIYGHWTDSIFGPTKNLVPGQKAFVYTSNGHIFEYTYTGKDTFNPKDTTIFEKLKGKPGLVLMTCQGTWAQQRRVMYFELVEAA